MAEGEDMEPTAEPAELSPKPTFAEATRFWLKLGFLSFGGPTGQIALMHEEVVVRRRWIGPAQFLHALNFCMLLPGPEAQQLSIYLGWLLHRTRGALVAGTLFVLPAAVILWALSWLYMAGQGLAWLEGCFGGLKAAVLAIVAVAGMRLARRALRSSLLWGIALGALAAVVWGKVGFPWVIMGAGVIGWGLGGKYFPRVAGPSEALEAGPRLVSWGRSMRVLLVGLLVWWTPVVLVGMWLGWGSLPVQQGVFFSKSALVTFGGAYAVLPYVAQQAVENYHWLAPTQMMDGLGLAETTPGPLIMVLQFVGFVGGWQHPVPGWSALASATLAAGITTWVTFAPCFLFILLGAPYVEKLRQHARIVHTLTAITAAVVGVMANLWGWFAVHTLVNEQAEGAMRINWWSVTLALGAFWLLQYRAWSVLHVVLLAAIVGVVGHLAFH